MEWARPINQSINQSCTNPLLHSSRSVNDLSWFSSVVKPARLWVRPPQISSKMRMKVWIVIYLRWSCCSVRPLLWLFCFQKNGNWLPARHLKTRSICFLLSVAAIFVVSMSLFKWRYNDGFLSLRDVFFSFKDEFLSKSSLNRGADIVVDWSNKKW